MKRLAKTQEPRAFQRRGSSSRDSTWKRTWRRSVRPVECLRYARAQVIFSQGDVAQVVKYIQKGAVKISVLSRIGKEAVVAILGPGDFFGEGVLTGQSVRIGTATALVPTSVLSIDKDVMGRLLRDEPTFSNRFISHMLSRNVRIEADLVDQLFNSSEKRLARTLLLMARYGQASPEATLPQDFAGDARGDHRHDPIARELLHEQVPKARVDRIQRHDQGQPIAA